MKRIYIKIIYNIFSDFMVYSRSKLEIVYDILIYIKNEEDGARSTHILYKANLSPTLLKKYLKVLVRDGLIRKRKTEDIVKYKITKKGLSFLKKLKSIDRITNIIELTHANRKK